LGYAAKSRRRGNQRTKGILRVVEGQRHARKKGSWAGTWKKGVSERGHLLVAEATAQTGVTKQQVSKWRSFPPAVTVGKIALWTTGHSGRR
jgi:hypothetical protein